ncbi:MULTISPECIES: head decoration protein [unclassified Sphingomonas]|uniref:head decoration protein n=1 Tax=unclassified Sphingomonas TaxID=196159 RepID=UPI00226AC9BC|nr:MULTISPECIES: head decoration protein [unclassified Sphingomonas]
MYSRASFASTQSAAMVTLIRSGAPNTKKVTLLAGAVYPIGAVLGIIDASKKANVSLAAANDGSQVPQYVLSYTVDATGGDVEAMAIETGDLIGSQLVLGAGHTLASIRAGLRDKGITFDG